MAKEKISDNFIKFLGTAGARFVMIKQLRFSGGIWVKCNNTNCLIDPGPGSLLRCAKSRPKLDATKLDGIILTHRHLDHSNDINVMIEAMTEGGFKKRGEVFLPEDALVSDSVLLNHTRIMPGKITTLKPRTRYSIKNLEFATSSRLKHSVETYGLRFFFKDKTVCLLTDTRYFDSLPDEFRCDILIINVVFPQPRPQIEHLSVDDAKIIIEKTRPEKTIITHFGMGMIKAKPTKIAEDLSSSLKTEVIAAYDGMTINLD